MIETMIWKEKRSRIRTVKMDNLRGLLGIRRMGKVTNPRIMINLLRSITRLAVHVVPYRRGSRDLVTGHLGGRTASGRQTGRRS